MCISLMHWGQLANMQAGVFVTVFVVFCESFCHEKVSGTETSKLDLKMTKS